MIADYNGEELLSAVCNKSTFIYVVPCPVLTVAS